MIDSELKNTIIRRFYVDHFTINAISESLSVHHDTVKRAISHDKFVRRKAMVKALDRFVPFIEEKLREHPKLRATRVIMMLKDRGFEGSITSLRKAMRGIRPRVKEVFIKRTVFPGEEGQVDWAHFGSMKVGKGSRKLYCFVMVLAYCRAVFAKFTFDMTTATFLRCHTEAFKFFEGVPKRIMIDNLKSGVIERQGNLVKYNDDMIEFANQYRFQIQACHVRRPQEKGRCERAIRYIRESFFEGRPLNDIVTLNEALSKWMQEASLSRVWPEDRNITNRDALTEERGFLLGLPPMLIYPPERRIVVAKKTNFIRYDRNQYSIPPNFVGQPLTLCADDTSVKFYLRMDEITCHQRSYDQDLVIEIPKHKEELTETKKSYDYNQSKSYLIREYPEIKEILSQLHEQGESMNRSLKIMSALSCQYQPDIFRRALRECTEARTPTVESLTKVLSRIEVSDGVSPGMEIKLPNRREVTELTINPKDVSVYDQL